MREALLGIAVGKKGVGKTYTTLETATQYLLGNNNGAKPGKVLILDVNNEYANTKGNHNNEKFPEIKAMRLDDVPRFTVHPKIEARRVSVLKPEGGKMSLAEIQNALGYILAHYQNGLLIIEDINKYISDSLPNDLMGSIATQRHVSVDIITHFQSIGKAANPKLWANCNWLRFHRCEDTVERHKTKFAGNIEHLKIMEKMIDTEFRKGNKRFYLYLDKDYGTIKGNFDKNIFRAAIEDYLEDNYNIVDRELKKKHLYSGERKHKNHKQAVTALVNDYIINYYGNSK
jgi:hypothetical protein|tara:strand:- start:4723 stop:5583 length:861 start_codon:yes stop_codon:yes gene_type:complete